MPPSCTPPCPGRNSLRKVITYKCLRSIEITLKPHYLDIPAFMNAWILTDMCTSAAKDIRCEISLQLRLYEECTIYIFYFDI